MLMQLRDFIAREQWVSIDQLTRAFQIDRLALEPMLAWWVRKGIIERHDGLHCAKACVKSCQTSLGIYYHYSVKVV